MIHIAIISHGHEDILIASRLGGLLDERARLTIWLKDNKPSARLKDYCQQHCIYYTDDSPGLGFGHNNNFIFERVEQSQGFQENDMFLVMNPDISVTVETIMSLVQQMQQNRHAIATLNLFRDAELTVVDHNIRHFPSITSILLLAFSKTFSPKYDKAALAQSKNPVTVEWASGAFLALTPSHFRALGGFDPSYFMYFEDVDLCYRSRQRAKLDVFYYPQLRAIHTAAHKNRNIASQHARWFLTSLFKFICRRYLPWTAKYPIETTNTK